MRTSVCIFFDEDDAKEMITHLRKDHLGVSLVERNQTLANGEELRLSILSAERPEHPLILSRVAEMDLLQETLLRCPDCQSARLSLPLRQLSSPGRRLAQALFERLSINPENILQPIICRDCNETIDLSEATTPLSNNESRVSDAIAA